MTSVQRRSGRAQEPASALGRIDRLFDEWMRTFPMRRPFTTGWDVPGEELIRVDEYREDAIRRLEEEQREFREFLDRLRKAKDKQEFDQFMAERRTRPAGGSEPATA